MYRAPKRKEKGEGEKERNGGSEGKRETIVKRNGSGRTEIRKRVKLIGY